ncbi:expressed unknown protein [Seminavis robusta]|uniref:Crossover junction endonuclease MUS81 n=1 Tax=Seminavis robusta TaxID=568900 RepID=A0A9N8HQ05_9STRA|nr:expressed unknown protein [Seminavis robusta]|eukprot:Sro1232_g254730.1 n/a (1383) ;mRNA; r:25343-29491
MVLVTIHVRPRDGYSYPNRIKTITVDSSYRLEQVISDLKLDTKKGIHLFSRQGAHELALNTSLATNNVQSGDIIETCSSPLLASVLSAALTDLNTVQSSLLEEERTRERIEPLLDLNSSRTLDPWTNRWNQDSMKSRIVFMALAKKVIQRQDRFANVIVPQCTTLHELYAFWTKFMEEQKQDQQPRRSHHNSMAHLFKPSTARDARPTTCWQLLQFKLDKLLNQMGTPTMHSDNQNNNPIASCPIEAFLAAETARHEQRTGVSTPSTTSRASRRKAPPSSERPNKRRRLAIESPSGRLKDQDWKCSTCTTAPADCLCLTEGCPFVKILSCLGCFSANHPPLQRNHQCVPFTDARAKAILKEMHRQGKQDIYCPQYASGPFAILCTLYRQMQKGQLSLDESRLKELAQPICRSNFYDHQARGRNAFACIESLMERDMVRMERLPGRRANQEGIYSLLPTGEALGKYCDVFQKQVLATVGENIPKGQHNNPITIVVDTREDQTYANRFIQRCQVERVPCEQRELPAGDYLFLVDDKVCPVVIERKTWSDLADSVLGKGRQQRRLDCVKIGSSSSKCENGRCQLCKMKASGCTKVMFLIEGARCDNRDDAPNKCTPERRCQFCREIQDRHGRDIVHERLEEVLFRLQVEHGCFIHYTRSYNETIDTMLIIRDVLGSSIVSTEINEDDDVARAISLSLGKAPSAHKSTPSVGSLSLTFDEFSKNARRKGENTATQLTAPVLVEWDDHLFIRGIIEGSIEESIGNLTSSSRSNEASHSAHVVDLEKSFQEAASSATTKDEASDSGASVMVLDGVDALRTETKNNAKKGSPPNDAIINIDSDDDDDLNASVEVVDHNPFLPKTEVLSDDEVEVVETKPPAKRKNEPHITSNNKNVDPAPALLLINGLYHYDAEFYKDVSAIWKALYHRQRAADSTDNEFRSQCAVEMQKLQSAESPLAGRSSILFWLLDIQIRRGVFVQVARESSQRQRLSSLLQSAAGELPLLAVAAPPVKTPVEDRSSGRRRGASSSASKKATGTPSTPIRRNSASSPKEAEHVCTICKSALGKLNVVVTPCMHPFHENCLAAWLSSKSGSRLCRCPMCNYDLTTYKKEKAKTKVQTSAKKHSERPPRPRGNTEADRVREARLARFDNMLSIPEPAARVDAMGMGTPVQANRNGWSCDKCTFQNGLHANQCQACGSARAKEMWSCHQCTYVNDPEASECGMCNEHRQTGTPGRNDSGSFALDFDYGSGPSCTPTLSRARVDIPTASAKAPSTDSTKKRIRCGACGQNGHNRASATEYNCPMYFDQAEIERRSKKAEEYRQKARKTEEAIDRNKRDAAGLGRKLEDAKRAVAELERAAAGQGNLHANEVKRLEKERKRAERQARKYE